MSSRPWNQLPAADCLQWYLWTRPTQANYVWWGYHYNCWHIAHLSSTWDNFCAWAELTWKAAKSHRTLWSPPTWIQADLPRQITEPILRKWFRSMLEAVTTPSTKHLKQKARQLKKRQRKARKARRARKAKRAAKAAQRQSKSSK